MGVLPVDKWKKGRPVNKCKKCGTEDLRGDRNYCFKCAEEMRKKANEDVKLEVNIDKQVEEFLTANRESFKDDNEAKESLIKAFKITPEKAEEYVKKMVKGETPMNVKTKVVDENKLVEEYFGCPHCGSKNKIALKESINEDVSFIQIKENKEKEYVIIDTRNNEKVVSGETKDLKEAQKVLKMAKINWVLGGVDFSQLGLNEAFMSPYIILGSGGQFGVFDEKGKVVKSFKTRNEAEELQLQLTKKIAKEILAKFKNQKELDLENFISKEYPDYAGGKYLISVIYGLLKEESEENIKESYINEIIHLSEGLREQEQIFHLIAEMFKLQKKYTKEDIITALKDYIHEQEVIVTENKQLKEKLDKEIQTVNMTAEKAAKLKKELEDDEKRIKALEAEKEVMEQKNLELTEAHTRELVKLYANTRVKVLGLKIPKQFNSILEACEDFEEVDRTIREIQDGIREGIVNKVSLSEIVVNVEKKSDSKQDAIDDKVAKVFKGFGM
jgi:hypothetical protein